MQQTKPRINKKLVNLFKCCLTESDNHRRWENGMGELEKRLQLRAAAVESWETGSLLSVPCFYYLSVCGPILSCLIWGTFQGVSLASLSWVCDRGLKALKDSFGNRGGQIEQAGWVALGSAAWDGLFRGSRWDLCATEPWGTNAHVLMQLCS